MTPSIDPEEALRSVPAPDSLPDISPAAAEAGLLDLAYVIEDTPVGPLLMAATPRASCGWPTWITTRRRRSSRIWPTGSLPGSWPPHAPWTGAAGS